MLTLQTGHDFDDSIIDCWINERLFWRTNAEVVGYSSVTQDAPVCYNSVQETRYYSPWVSEATPCGPMGPSYASLKLGVGVYFRVLLRWWLGKKIVDIPAADSTTLCPFCSEPCDCYGDHIMCCRRVEFHSRHHAVVSALTHAMESAGCE